jgi:hypothetical protein
MPHLRFKRHYKLLVLLVLLVAVLVAGAGDRPIVAYSAPDLGQVAAAATANGHSLPALLNAALDGLRISGSVELSGAAGAYLQ